MMACVARLWLVFVAVAGMTSHEVVHLQPTQSDPASAETFQQLFYQYLHRDGEGAVQAFAAWDDETVQHQAQLLPNTAQLKPALALFHSEAWLRSGSRAHYTAAVRLMIKEICPAARANKDARILALCRDWYGVFVVTGKLFDSTADLLPDSGAVQLARGAMAEYMAGPAVDSGGGADHGFLARELGQQYIVTSHGWFGPIIADAVSSFSRALKIDPLFAEARARLGRVLSVLDRRDEARRELEQAFADAARIGDSHSEYLAAMFLARLHEESDRPDDAIQAYRRAAAAGPRFPAARVALARLLAETNRADEASSMMAGFFRQLAPSGTSEADPWTVYPRGRTFWYRDQILRALREAVRRDVRGVRSSVGVQSVSDKSTLKAGSHSSVPFDRRMTQVVLKARAPERLSVVFAVDTSASVTVGRMEFPRRWNPKPENFHQLAAAVRSVLSCLKDGDDVSLIMFSDRLRLAVPPTTDPRQIVDALQPERIPAPSAQVRSTVWDAAMAATALAAGRPERSIVILLTDGTDNASWLPQADVISAARHAGVAVDLISVPRTYGTLDEDPPGSWDVDAISEETGGEAFSARDRDLLGKIVERLEGLRQQQ